MDGKTINLDLPHHNSQMLPTNWRHVRGDLSSCRQSNRCQNPGQIIKKGQWRTKGCRIGPGKVHLLFNADGRANSTGMSEPDRVYAWPENGGGDGEVARSCIDDFGELHSDVPCIGVRDCTESGVRYVCVRVCAIDAVEARRGM